MAELTQSTLWWEEKRDRLHDVLGPVYKRIRQENAWKRDADRYHFSLYAGAEGEAAITFQSMEGYTYAETQLPFNVARSATDTLVAKIGKHRPLPQVLTTRGDWKQQKRARKCTQFLEGAFYKHRIFEEHSPRIVRDAAIFRRGGWLFVRRPSRASKRVVVERALPWEVDHDNWDGRYDTPCNRYYCRTMDKGVCVRTWGQGDGAKGRVDAIEKGGSFDPNHAQYNQSTTVKRVDVLEAWHLCDDREAHELDEEHKCNGRHVVMVPHGVLVDEPYEESFLPGCNLRYSEPIAGCDGQSLVQQLEGFQYELNVMSEVVCEGYQRNAMTLITVPDGAAVNEQQIRNGIHVLYYRPVGPIGTFQPNPVHPSIYARQHDLVRDALGEGGLSMMSAQASETDHQESGIARQSRDDVESERHIIFGRYYEAWCLNVARHLIACIKGIAEDHGEYAVDVPMKNGILPLNWKDVDVESYELRVFATSMLPQQLSARMDKLKMYWESGILDRSTFLRLLDAPDMQAEMDIETADKLVIDEQIEYMLDAEESEGEAAFKTPSPYVDLKWAAKRAQQRFNRIQLDGAPEWNLSLLQRYEEWCIKQMQKIGLLPPDADYEHARAMLNDKAPAPGTGPIGPATPPPPGGPPGAPMPPPGLGAQGQPMPTAA